MTGGSITRDIWQLCHILRGDGITYYQYMSELSYLLFLKFAQENNSESLIPAGYRWADLESHEVGGLLGFYQEMLTHLGAIASNDVVRAVYAFPTTAFSHSENLKAVVEGIGKLKWQQVGLDRFGDIYSGLIEKSTRDARSGAGQYFTPRPLVDSIIETISPRLGELIQDPAAGSGGFLVAADRFLRRQHTGEQYARNRPTYHGVEIEKNARRICLMNTFLHNLDAKVLYGDALTDDVRSLEPPDIIVANPPFGTRSGSKRSLRADISIPTKNKQLAFLQHIYTSLKGGGRAAVVVPDNVLFDEGAGRSVRRELMRTCDLHTILRLPTGIFSNTGIKTNVLYFAKPKSKTARATQMVWIYDMRTNMPHFGRRVKLTSKWFQDFEIRFGTDPEARQRRTCGGAQDRFQCFSREEIAARDDNLNITWLKSGNQDESHEPVGGSRDITEAIGAHLRAALSEFEFLVEELSGVDVER